MRIVALIALAATVIPAAAHAGEWDDWGRAWNRRYQKRTLEPHGNIRGHLVDASGQGLPGLVALRTPDGAVISQTHAVSIQGGLFDIGRVAPGRYVLTVTSLGPFITDMARPAPMEITVDAKRTVRPVLTAVAGRP
ncbi:MAG: hypothetical protein K0Q72_5033 [Armatimonadetes bacterium]|jgi:hypothetical protein|nr:hypothetical protein [Armatimonadota bacterium]